MDKKYERDYLDLEKSNFWFVARRELIVSLVRDMLGTGQIKDTSNVLEIGCGSGLNILTLKKEFPKMFFTGLEVSEELCKQSIKNNNKTIFCDLNQFETEEKFDLIICLDVLEHIEDDQKALKKIRDMSLPNKGHVLLAVPCFDCLWGNHDIVNNHKRRYTKKQLFKKNNCFLIKRATYWNISFFIPILLIRTFQRIFKSKNHIIKSDFEKTGIFNLFFLLLLRIENKLIKNKINLPFGVSCFLVMKNQN